MAQKVISALQRVKDRDGQYVIMMPIITIDEVLMDLESGKSISELIREVDDSRLTMIEDLAEVVNALAGLIDVDLKLRHMYRENFKNTDDLLKTSGTFFEGGVRANVNETIEFQFSQPYDIPGKPSQFKIKNITEFTGNPGISCLITFNGKDANPTWFDCAQVFTSGLFADIPEITNKEEGIPYSMNLKFKCICDSTSTFELNDITILYL